MRKSSLYIIISLLFCNLSCTEYLDVKNKGEVIPETAEEFSALLHRHLYSIDGAGEYAFFGAPSTAASYEAYTDNWDADLTTKLDLPIYVGSDISSLSFRFKSLYEVIRDCNIVIGELKVRRSPLRAPAKTFFRFVSWMKRAGLTGQRLTRFVPCATTL